MGGQSSWIGDSWTWTMHMKVMVIILMLTGTWMTIQNEIEGDVMQQNAWHDNACVGALEHCDTVYWALSTVHQVHVVHCDTEHRILAAIVVFAQISVNSCRCTHVPVTQFPILNVPIYLSIKSSIYLWEYQCTLSLFTCVPCSTSNQPSCSHTRSHCHCVTVSLTVSLCLAFSHCATVSLFHCVTVWLCHIVTVSCFCHCVAVSLSSEQYCENALIGQTYLSHSNPGPRSALDNLI